MPHDAVPTNCKGSRSDRTDVPGTNCLIYSIHEIHLRISLLATVLEHCFGVIAVIIVPSSDACCSCNVTTNLMTLAFHW